MISLAPTQLQLSMGRSILTSMQGRYTKLRGWQRLMYSRSYNQSNPVPTRFLRTRAIKKSPSNTGHNIREEQRHVQRHSRLASALHQVFQDRLGGLG